MKNVTNASKNGRVLFETNEYVQSTSNNEVPFRISLQIHGAREVCAKSASLLHSHLRQEQEDIPNNGSSLGRR